MGIIGWFIFGALAGWVAHLLVGGEGQGCFMNALIGVVGAFIGGVMMKFVTNEPWDFAFNFPSFIVAVVGAVVLLAITGFARRSRR